MFQTMTATAAHRFIATGTPGGVGHARARNLYLVDDTVLATECEGLSGQRNLARAATTVPV